MSRDRPDAEDLDDHDRLVIVEARLDLVDERLARPTPPPRPALDPVAQRQRDTITALTVAWCVVVLALGAFLWRLTQALEGVLT